MDVSGLTVEQLTAAVHAEAALLAAEAQHSTALGRVNQRLDRQAVDEVNNAAPLVKTKAVQEFAKAAKKYVAAVKKLPSGVIRPELLLKQDKDIQDAYYSAVSARGSMDDAVEFISTLGPPEGELATVVTLFCKPETYQAYQSVINTHKEVKGKEAFNDRLGTLYLAIARSGIPFGLVTPQVAYERERVLLAAGSEEAPSNPFHGKFDTSTPVRTL